MGVQVLKNTKTVMVSSDGLASCLGLTRPRVIQLCNEGIIQKDEHGKYLLAESVARYCEYLRSGQTEKKTDTQAQYWQEKAQHEASRREMASINLGKIKGELLDAKEIEMALGGMLTAFRRRMLSLPHKMAKILAGKKEREIGKVLKKEIDSALTDLSECDVSKFGNGGEAVDDAESS